MKKHYKNLFSVLLTLIIITSASANYMKMTPPPDVDKEFTSSPDNSCWMATASNMLAGAGYGNGSNVQERAEDIYDDMVANYGVANGGWTDTALSWWLNSSHNVWSSNPYRIVTVNGHKSREPWQNTNAPRIIGNRMRNCRMIGLSISWPRNTSTGSPFGGHAFTCWGDDGDEKNLLSSNPSLVYATDSDRNNGGNVQVYSYDSYTNPNPGGFNEGNGWYLNYSNNHPFIKHIITLSPAKFLGIVDFTIQGTLSYKLRQGVFFMPANGLHYRVGGNNDIFTYRTYIDWETDNEPVVNEDGNPPRNITFDWDLSDNTVPYNEWVTVNTEVVLQYPLQGGIGFRNIYFKYPEHGYTIDFPSFDLQLISPLLKQEEPSRIPNVSGGYVIGSFDLIFVDEQNKTQEVVAEYRFAQEYNYRQDPELHHFELLSEEREPYLVGNLRFGHSYGLPEGEELWAFNDWMSRHPQPVPLNEFQPIQIDWYGLLPYPEGEDYERDEKPLECSVFLPEDINKDCVVDIEDFRLLANRWLQTTIPKR